jgi:phosphoglycolate phosphatase-like HAD superfamily hydrolase
MKPHPDQILRCLEEIGVDPSQGLVVGDSVKDVQAAKAAKVLVVSIPSFFTSREAIERLGADAIIGGLNELPAVIEKLDGLR